MITQQSEVENYYIAYFNKGNNPWWDCPPDVNPDEPGLPCIQDNFAITTASFFTFSNTTNNNYQTYSIGTSPWGDVNPQIVNSQIVTYVQTPALLALAPIIVVWLWMADEERAWQVALGRIALLALVCVATLAALYWPFWIGGATFDGLQREAGKIIRSLHALLGAWFGLSPGCLRACGLAGNLLAAAAGAWICWRRKSLAQGLLVGLLAQVVLGRTFLQPWHFCPALLLVPFLGFAARPPASGGLRWAELRSLLVLSVSALAGGYVALLWVPGSRADALQTISFLCIVLPPAIWWGIEIWNLKSRIWNRKDSIY